jgi:hypothetical protein
MKKVRNPIGNGQKVKRMIYVGPKGPEGGIK